ncbi:hypothetical protein PPL_06288 [Heterostelium album PN500]|uniref:CENP-V/GFA domain-containing protein n=1 Tax=Heterostelium pallidum (strain ATCC 26659 / Pp 5 / PN500) TaxID=670386 RepID=D3BCR1_HETP5|nr:hypothetical protein PPL_06288 [Heterostelium album PN500]EFA80703.1 hypothetical protein PPL_06288 [Heterostelium album PN500]|eukprot:XP_020432823.1 hypothetical protein PPL_06288 [Heterostelium album PN500]
MDSNTPTTTATNDVAAVDQSTVIPSGVRVYTGQCFCGDIKFTVEADLNQLKSGRCNCSFCVKHRGWFYRLENVNQFKLLTPEENMMTFSRGNHACKKCAVYTHAIGDYGEGPYCSVAVNCIDDLTPAQKSAIPITYFDGLNNNWWSAPSHVNYL